MTKFVAQLQSYLNDVAANSSDLLRQFVLQAKSIGPPNLGQGNLLKSLNLLDERSEGNSQRAYRQTWGRFLMFVIGLNSSLGKNELPAAISAAMKGCDADFLQNLKKYCSDFELKLISDERDDQVIEAGLNLILHVLGQTMAINKGNETTMVVYLFLVGCMSSPDKLPSSSTMLKYAGRLKMLLSKSKTRATVRQRGRPPFYNNMY
jgi:hypothetical protein